MSDETTHNTPAPLRAIRIDPDQCNVALIEIDLAEVTGNLGSEILETIELDNGQCLVIDDGTLTPTHRPKRFRLADGPARPFFGPALILGIHHLNWTSTTVTLKTVEANIVWEEWNVQEQCYAAMVLENA
jgi:hypothetical protein